MMDVLIAELERDERTFLDEYERRRHSFVWSPTAGRWKHMARGIRHTIDVLTKLAADGHELS